MDASIEDFHTERVEDFLLYDALERTGTIGRIVSLLGQIGAGLVTEFEMEVLGGKAFFQTDELDVDDLADLLVAQTVKDDDLIDAVEELGAEMSA